MSLLSDYWKTKKFDNKVNTVCMDNHDYHILKTKNLLVEKDDWKKHNAKFSVDLPAEPFVGDLNAGIYIITLNPKTSEGEHTNWANSTLEKLHDDCLKQQKNEYPFYYLNPAISNTGGAHYWKDQKFNGLIRALSEHCGSEDIAIKKIAQNVCDLELCPYHSRKWDPDNFKKHGLDNLNVVKIMKDFVCNVVVPGVISGDKTLLVGRGRELFKSEKFNYNGNIIRFDDLESQFPDRVIFYTPEQCQTMSFTPYGYTQSGGGGTKGGQLLLETLKKL